MKKIIAITGNSGSGKSLLACQLASLLSKKEEVLIINTSAIVPSHPIWQPMYAVEKSKSLGILVSWPIIHIPEISKAIETVKDNKNIGLLGYTVEDSPLSYVELSYKKSYELITNASQLISGYIILDCSSDFSDSFRPAALELANHCFMVVTPDLSGLHYYKNQRELLQSRRAFKFNATNVLAGKAKSYQPIEQIGKETEKGFFGILDYSEDIEKATLRGEMFNSLKYCTKRTLKTLHDIQAVIES